MAAFSVAPAELIRLADAEADTGTILGTMAALLEQGSTVAASGAGPELGAALKQFCDSWAAELRREAEGAAVTAANLRTAAGQYEGAEDRASQI